MDQNRIYFDARERFSSDPNTRSGTIHRFARFVRERAVDVFPICFELAVETLLAELPHSYDLSKKQIRDQIGAAIRVAESNQRPFNIPDVVGIIFGPREAELVSNAIHTSTNNGYSTLVTNPAGYLALIDVVKAAYKKSFLVTLPRELRDMVLDEVEANVAANSSANASANASNSSPTSSHMYQSMELAFDEAPYIASTGSESSSIDTQMEP